MINHDLIIKLTNRIALYAAVSLIYWVFIFMIITVFDLKIFREQMTEMFFLSLLGIFAILGGSIILNMMSNLSKISTALAPASICQSTSPKRSRLWLLMVFASFPLLAMSLFAGDRLSSDHKKSLLILSAERIISENGPLLSSIANYQFSPEYVKTAERNLNILNKIDKHFPEIMLIILDTIETKRVFLGFGGRSYHYGEKEEVEKYKYIYSTTLDERDYLERVFSGTEKNYRFDSDRGNYRLYFPVTINGVKIILYFSDFQRYGKLGS